MENLQLPAPRGRGRGRRGVRDHPVPTNLTDRKESKDLIVQQTDQDASQSRLSAVETGYLVDDFVKALSFVHDCKTNNAVRKYPLINRGTYVRTTALDLLVDRFLLSSPSSQKKQIVSLGAGSDTRFFRLHRTHPDDVTAALIYHELDFAAVTTRKVAAIMRDETNTLQATIGRDDITAADAETGTFTSKRYHIHSVDLRVLRPHCDLPAPIAASIDPSLPTLLISECCLIYLAPEEADAILLWATEIFKSSVGIIIYEPIGGNDSFGKVMVQNLAARGIVLKTLERYSTLSRQRERLRTLGFTDCCDAADICFVHDKWLNQSERDRIARLELLDEVEEWNMLAKHYCVAWGWRGKGFDLWKGAVPVQPNT